MDGYIGPLTNTIIDNIVKEFKKKHNKEKLFKNVIDPLLKDLTTRYYPHFVTITAILIIIVILLIILLFVVVMDKYGSKCENI